MATETPKTAQERTKYPGIWKLTGPRGSVYKYVYRDRSGAQRYGRERTLTAAKAAKAKVEAEVTSGTAATTDTNFADHVRLWVESYAGRTKRGVSPETRDEYRRQLQTYWINHFGERVALKAITPPMVAAFYTWLADDEKQGRHLGDATLKRIKAPGAAMFADAVERGLIPRNPTTSVRLPVRDHHQVSGEDEDDEIGKAPTREQVSKLLMTVPEQHRLLVEFVALTGLRISEVAGLQWQHVDLSGDRPVVRVRQRWRKGKMGPPKSRAGRREVPISRELAVRLQTARDASEWPEGDRPVFPGPIGGPLDAEHLTNRMLAPAAAAAGCGWVRFHALRHFCASRLIEEGRTIVQVARWLGHADPAFTLRTYAHLLDDGVGGALEVL